MPLKKYTDSEALLASTKAKLLHCFVKRRDMGYISWPTRNWYNGKWRRKESDGTKLVLPTPFCMVLVPAMLWVQFFSPLLSRNNVISKLWAVIYPIDMIKSRMQTDGFTPATGQKYASTLDCVRTVWRAEGIGAFTRGLGPTLIRYELPASSVEQRNNLFFFTGHPSLTVRHSLGLRWRCASWIDCNLWHDKRISYLIYLEFRILSDVL
jgi:hypothetical protein